MRFTVLATKFVVLEPELLKFFHGDLVEPIAERGFPGLERDDLGLGRTVAGPDVGVGLDRQALHDQRPLGFPEGSIFVSSGLQHAGCGGRRQDR